MSLTGKQRRYLRAQAHHLKPVVLTGGAGVTDAVIEKVDVELENHELIKVKVADDADDLRAVADGIATRTRSEVAQVIGKTVVLYRRRKKDPEIKLPTA